MRVLTLTITGNCNLHCEHCWPMCGSDAPLPGVATFVLERVIGQFAQSGINEICLTGGEPLTHPDWFSLLLFCCAQPNLERVRLQTNATLMTPAIACRLADSHLDKLNIEVSLDGAVSATHDRIRGAGSFRRTLRGLQCLIQAGLGRHITVAFTEMAHNFNELPGVLALLKELGIPRLVSGTLVQSGRAGRSVVTAPPTSAQYLALLERFHRDPEFQADYHAMGNIACLEWFAGRDSKDPVSCRCAGMPYVTADGILFPCTLMPLPSYGVPGVFSRPLGDVLNQALRQWMDLPNIYDQRRSELAACDHCRGHSHCGGGCPGRAFVAGNGFMAVEDRCALRQAVYGWRAGRQEDE
jgi:radical SAM protein with 4Fe4S-binding SPASM domain